MSLEAPLQKILNELRMEYAEFQMWCDEYNLEIWEPFVDYVALKYAAKHDNLTAEEAAVMRKIHANEICFP